MLEKQKYVSLAAVVVAAVLFGMVLAGGLGVTPRANADNPSVVEQPPLTGTTVPDFAALADRVVPSVVSVFSTEVADPSDGRGSRSPHPFGFFFGPQNQDQEQEPTLRRSSGSGFFISTDGELLTNYHVIADADKIEIELEDDTRYQVKVIGRDPETDIALLKVIDADREFPMLPLGDAESLRVGEWVMAVGNPLNMDHTVTVGVVSAKGRVLGLSDQTSFENFIQTDAAINFGNSGGPLVNLRGETIGINTAINARGQNLGFAVPVNTAKRILTSLRENGKVVRGYLGVMVKTIDQDIEESFGLNSRDGAFVEDVVKDHAADKGGLKPGDVIVKVNGAKIKTTRELIDVVSSLQPKSDVSLEIVRNGSSKNIKVTLEEREAADDVVELGNEGNDSDSLLDRVGISVSELNSRNRQHFQIDPEIDGAVITRVRAVSPAGEKGLMSGDIITQVNGVAIESEDDLRAAIAEIAKGGLARIYIFRPQANRNFFAILRLDEIE